MMRGACRRARFTVAVCALLIGPCVFALNPSFEVSQYAHKSWTAADGFFKGTITAIAQTPDGCLWLGTDFGLLRFDGVRFVAWTPPAGEQLPSEVIRGLLVTRDGSLWIATFKGLARWKGGRLTGYREFAGRMVDRMLEDHSGAVWATWSGAPAGRLCAIQDSGVRCYGDDGPFDSNVVSLYEYQGGLWAGTSRGLWRWKPDPPQRYPAPGSQLGLSDLMEGDDGALWIATRDGIHRWIAGKIEPTPLPATGRINAYRMLRDRDGGVWIGTAGQGLVHLHQGRMDGFTSMDSLSGNTVGALFQDGEGNLWVATDEGLDRFRDLAAPTISIGQGGRSASGAVVAARDGSIWAGTGDGLERWSDGRITVYRKPGGAMAIQSSVREIHDGGLPDNVIESIFEDSRGRIWVSTPRGVAYLENDRFIPVASVPSTMVHSIAEEGSESFWINDQHLGLIHLVESRVVEQISWASLGHQDVAGAVAVDAVRGGLWLGFFQGGLAYFKDGRIRASYGTAEGLGGGRVNDIRIDREGTLWAATEGGLSRLKAGRIATLTRRNGLPCEAVHWTMEDDARSVWLKLPCGLARVGRDELDAWAAGTRPAVIPVVFDGSDGVKLLSTAPGYSPRAAKSPDGRLWFASLSGVSVIDPRHLPFNKLPPPIHIEQMTADRKTYDPNAMAGLRLPPLVRDLEIEYTALSLVAPEKNQFRYKLEGHDRDWVDAGTRRQAFYNDLPPRNYRFRVMAANNSGVWNEAGAFVDFAVAPAYYQTTWFRALVAATALGLLAVLYRLRLLYLARQFTIRMDERVNERTRLARDLHDTLLQSFQGVLLKFHAVTYRLPDRPEAKRELEAAIEQAREAIAEGRDAVQGLRSSVVVTNDLARAITTFGEGLASDQNGRPAPDFHVAMEGTSRDLAPLVRDEVYRIAGESLRNAFRHADARRIEVEIRYETRLLRLRVRDNGKGIDPQVLGAGERGGHHGLPGMRERAELVGGKLAVWSELDSGTEIELTVPAAVAYAKASHSTETASAGHPR